MTDLAQHRNHYDPKGVRVPREPGGSDQRGCLRTTHLPEPAAEVQPRLAVHQDTRAQSKRCTMCLKPNTPKSPRTFAHLACLHCALVIFFPTHPHQFSLHALSTCRSAFIASSERTGERPLPLRNSAVQHFGFACTCICLPFILLYFTFESVVSERHAHRLQRLKQIDQQVRSHPLEAVR